MTRFFSYFHVLRQSVPCMCGGGQKIMSGWPCAELRHTMIGMFSSSLTFFYCDAVGLSPMWLILIASEDVCYSSRLLKSSFFFISCNTSIIRPSGPDACYFSCGFWADFEFEL